MASLKYINVHFSDGNPPTIHRGDGTTLNPTSDPQIIHILDNVSGYWISTNPVSERYRVLKILPSVIPPGKKFDGYFHTVTKSGIDEMVVDENGVPTFTTDLAPSYGAYARFSDITYAGTFDANGGSGGGVFHYAADETFGAKMPQNPIRQGFAFEGWFDGATEITPSSVWTWNADKTFLARWRDISHTLTFDPNGGTVSPSSKSVYEGGALGALPEPSKSGWYFDGWWTEAEGGYRVDSSSTCSWTSDMTVYAHWTLDEQYTLAFDAQGGYVSPQSKKVKPGYAIGVLPTPTKFANTFLGWFTSASGGTEWTSATTYIIHTDTTLYAQWSPDPQYARTISLNAEGGTVSPSTISCTYGLQIGPIPIPAKSGKLFNGWFTSASGGVKYTADMTCDWSGTLTLHAHWSDDAFGMLTDWFGLETANGPLMLVASNSGATRSVVETSHTGALAIQTADSSVGAFERGGILMNPTCTYRIRKSGTVQIKVGKAYGSATITGAGTASNPYRATKSGYMLLQAEYATTADGEPVLVVRGTANEGYVWTNGMMVSQLTDAINLWTVNLQVNPDHIAQDPMNAVSGGGEMTECKTLITCDPVVPMEGGMPCASDVVHGKIVVTATTNAYLGESDPTAAGSFVEINGDPNSETDVDYTSYAFHAERSL